GLAYVSHDLFRDTPEFPNLTPPTKNHAVSIVTELAAYGFTGISEEEFHADWFEPVGQACRQNGMVYMHKSIPPDYGAYTSLFHSTCFDVFKHCDILMTEDYEVSLDPPLLPTYQHIPSIAQSLGKPYYIKACTDHCGLKTVKNMENTIVLKAIQYRPKYIYFMTWNSDFINTYDLPDLTHLIQDCMPDEEEKPVCNLVLHLTGDTDPDTWDWWNYPVAFAAVSGGLSASGYEMITTPTPMDDADAYYIVTRGVWGNWGEPAYDLSDDIVGLFDSGKPVFLQITQRLPNSTANWQAVRSKLGIDNADFSPIRNTGSALDGNYQGVMYPHVKQDWYFNDIKPENLTAPAEAVSTCEWNDKTYALIIKNANNHFINGNWLDYKASFPISNLVGNGFQKPTACAGSAGRGMSVFYALDMPEDQGDTTDFHIRLPDPAVQQIEWIKRDMEGVVSAGIMDYDSEAGYADSLQEGTLLILRRAKETRVQNWTIY
ncbi:MAG: hypothetical protein ABIH23_27735, partial [bacterium]